MFVGEFYHQVDDKGRIRIPTKFKHELGENPFIIQGADKCIKVYPKEVAEELLRSTFADAKFNDRAMDANKAKLMSKAGYCEEDKQGRVTLPQALMNYAGITLSSSITTVGAYDHVQIWDKDTWKKFSEGDNAGEKFDEIKEQN